MFEVELRSAKKVKARIIVTGLQLERFRKSTWQKFLFKEAIQIFDFKLYAKVLKYYSDVTDCGD